MPGIEARKVRSTIAGVAGIASLVALAVTGVQAGAAPGISGAAAREINLRALTATSHQADALTIEEATAYSMERTAPALTVSGNALAAAEAQAAALPSVGGRWTQLTTGSDNAQPPRLQRPHLVERRRRVPQRPGERRRWLPTGRRCTQDLRMVESGSPRTGVTTGLRSATGWRRSRSVRLRSTPRTTRCGWAPVRPIPTRIPIRGRGSSGPPMAVRRSRVSAGVSSPDSPATGWCSTARETSTTPPTTASGGGAQALVHSPWTLVLKPDPNPTHNPYQTSFITDVVVEPGTGGATVLAADGWRGQGNPPADTAFNGFYLSTSHGQAGTFSELTLSGAINASDLGRTTFAYAATVRSCTR